MCPAQLQQHVGAQRTGTHDLQGQAVKVYRACGTGQVQYIVYVTSYMQRLTDIMDNDLSTRFGQIACVAAGPGLIVVHHIDIITLIEESLTHVIAEKSGTSGHHGFGLYCHRHRLLFHAYGPIAQHTL